MNDINRFSVLGGILLVTPTVEKYFNNIEIKTKMYQNDSLLALMKFIRLCDYSNSQNSIFNSRTHLINLLDFTYSQNSIFNSTNDYT